MGLSDNPYIKEDPKNKTKTVEDLTNEMLYCGVSSEGQGRDAYLKVLLYFFIFIHNFLAVIYF